MADFYENDGEFSEGGAFVARCAPSFVISAVWIGLIFAFVACIALTPLLVLHIWLLCKGLSTYDYIVASERKEKLPTKSSSA